MTVSDKFMGGGKGPDANPSAGENAGFDHDFAQLFAQGPDIVALVELWRILDRQVRHAFSLFA